jgi:hypothetical protein
VPRVHDLEMFVRYLCCAVVLVCCLLASGCSDSSVIVLLRLSRFSHTCGSRSWTGAHWRGVRSKLVKEGFHTRVTDNACLHFRLYENVGRLRVQARHGKAQADELELPVVLKAGRAHQRQNLHQMPMSAGLVTEGRRQPRNANNEHDVMGLVTLPHMPCGARGTRTKQSQLHLSTCEKHTAHHGGPRFS